MKLAKISKIKISETTIFRISIHILFFLFSQNYLINQSVAFSPETQLENKNQEQRAKKLFLEVRCLVCQGQVIESSDAEFALEMRKLIREKISQNKSDNQIKIELAREFGEDIFVKSQFKKDNYLIWLIPLIFFVTSLIFFLRNYQRNKG